MRTGSYVSEELSKMMITQISKEQYNANLYLAMCSFFEKKGLHNTSKWFHHQYEEETTHANKIFGFLIDAGIHVIPQTVEASIVKGDTPLALASQYTQAERDTTDSIRKICDQALDDSDFVSFHFLSDLISEQQTEEDESTRLENTYKLANNEILADHQVPDLFPSFFK